MPPSPTHPLDALSNSDTGDSYTGLGCFPLGTHINHTDTSDLVSTLRHLRARRILHPIPATTLETVKAQLSPLQAAQSFWLQNAPDAPQTCVVHDLLEALTHVQDGGSETLKLYIFPDSTRLSSIAPPTWGLYEIDADTHTTYLYISAKSTDLAGTVLHTFMSSRRCSRLQCFLAEYGLAEQTGGLSERWGLPGRLQGDVDLLGKVELGELLERFENEGSLEAGGLFAKLRGYCEEMLERKTGPIWWAEGMPWS
jgi:hypothetical protein